MITPIQYEQFLTLVINELESDWIIIGGSLLAILNASNRATTDIDICPVGELTNEKRLQLMNLAQKTGLPIEAINPSADFFLNQIPNWKQSLVLFKTGARGNLYRPSLELYLKLKLNRGSESDIQDCISFIQWHKKSQLLVESEKIHALLLSHDPKKTKIILDSL